MTRREALRGMGMTGLAGGLCGSGLPLGGVRLWAQTEVQAATIFALIGDRYHNSDHYRTAFGKTLVRDMSMPVDFSDEVTLLNDAHLGRYRVLIILRDGINWPNGHTNPSSNAGWWSQGQHEIVSDPPVPQLNARSVPWMTAAMGRAVRSFVENGGGALFMHNVTNVSLYNDDFRDVMGGAYQGHPNIRPFRVKITNADHPITRGVRDFTVTDEQHYMEYQKDPKYLLMQSVNEDGLTFRNLGATAAAGWAYDYGKGRVCYLSPGHLITAMWNPEYEKIQRNAVRWLLRQI
jgi:type 1 glutamine amidotransferase